MQDELSRQRRRGPGLARLVLALGLTMLGAGRAAPADAPPLRVFAAASLTEVVEALASRFPEAQVEPSFGASSDLARQIRDGAPADVFLSASPEWIDFLQEADAVAGAPAVFARNQLVCVAKQGSVLAATDPKALLAALAPDERVAIADEGVPAGSYARKSLQSQGLLQAFTPKLVGQKDVRAVLHAVEQGELSAGFVYATDARVAAVTTLFAFDPATYPPIVYEAAVPKGAPHPAEAQRFLAFLRGEAARKLLTDAGFGLP